MCLQQILHGVLGRKLPCEDDVASASTCTSPTWSGEDIFPSLSWRKPRSIARAATRSVAGTAGVRLPGQFEGIPRELISDPDRPKGE